MIDNEKSHRKGRPKKDLALILRDRYFVLHLQNRTKMSFAKLERELVPTVRVTPREDGQGDSQPFLLNKVAAGTRGFGAALGVVPEIVQRAEELFPGVAAKYESVLWYALMMPLAREIGRGQVSEEISRRFHKRHIGYGSREDLPFVLLNLAGVRRASRLMHLDAIGLLLFHTPAILHIASKSIYAEECLFNTLHFTCCRDPALNAIKSDLVQIIKCKYEISPYTSRIDETKVFPNPKITNSRLAVSFFTR